MTHFTRVTASAAVLTLAAACSGIDYQPARERSLVQIAQDGCGERGEHFIVRGRVAQAYENTVVLRDVEQPQATVAATLPGRSPLARVRGWFGQSKYEVSQDRLRELARQNIPVTVTLECQGGQVAPEAQRLAYVNADGQRVAIGY